MVTDLGRGVKIYKGLVPQGRTRRELDDERERACVCAKQRISKRDKDRQCYESPEQKPPHKAV